VRQYLDALQYILENGRIRQSRAGSTIGVFGYQMRFKVDLNAFPILTTKKVNFDAVLKELLWFISGDTNSTTLENQGVNIWKPWALKEDIPVGWGKTEEGINENHLMELNHSATIHCMEGNPFRNKKKYPNEDVPFNNAEHVEILQEKDYEKRVQLYADWGFTSQRYKLLLAEKGALGPVYSACWRHWECSDGRIVDQLKELMSNLVTHPYSRRHILSAWNPEVLPDESKTHEENILNGKAVLASCHALFQLHVEELTLQERIEIYFSGDNFDLVVGDTRLTAENYKGFLLFDEVTQQLGLTTVVLNQLEQVLGMAGIPTQRLNSQLYQR